MKIIIHRGTHQIGGIATEIFTDTTRILIDMGDELSLDPDFISKPLQIPGVTDDAEDCHAVLFTHYHGDHTGQLSQIRDEIPLYAGSLAKDVMLKTEEHRIKKDAALCGKIRSIQTFVPGKVNTIGDMRVTPYSIDHSACDSYLFLIEAEGKRLLYTGDYRMHGFRGHAIPKILKKIGKVDALITEGTTLSRPDTPPDSERTLQQKVREYMEKYKYVFVLCASTNLERICAFSKAVPKGKYFICDDYQKELLELIENHWGCYSELYRDIKKTTYGENIKEKLKEKGFLMMVRDNRKFREIIKKFNPENSIILYSMWDGYRTKPGSTIPSFLSLAGTWETLHTSGHASHSDIKEVITLSCPDIVIPMHSDNPSLLQSLCPKAKVILPEDKEEIAL